METRYSSGSPTGLNHQILDQEASLAELFRTGKSLIRFGDGEATIMEGGHLYFQRNTPELMCRMRAIMKDYSRNSPYLIAVPPQVMLSFSESECAGKENKIWRKARYIFSSLLPESESPPLLDAMMFREDSLLKNSDISKLWVAAETVYFVNSNYKYYTDFCTNSKRQNVRFVSIFGANAYANISKVISEITRHADSVAGGAATTIALISAGPAAKVIVAELAARGIRALDCGHYFDYKFYDIRRGYLDK